jgi:DNA-binding MurR/RpiR family transcriptional regulator
MRPETIESSEQVLQRLLDNLARLTPQQRVAAQHILDHPRDVGVSSLRELAAAAGVTPNTLVRLAQALEFDGFESLREPFRASARQQPVSPLERDEWLDAVAGDGSGGQLLGSVAAAALGNLERLYRETKPEQLERAARRLLKARTIYVFGISTLLAPAKLFTALARMAMGNIVSVPSDNSLPLDDLARAGRQDVLLAMTFEPYRREAVEVVRQARAQGVAIVVLTDSWKSPVVTDGDEIFTMPATAPHVFTSAVAITAFVELLIAYLIRAGGKELRTAIGNFHRRRFEAGLYWTEKPRR